MKWIAGALLLLNLMVGAYFYWFQSWFSAQADAYSPINADKIVLLSARLANGQPPAAVPPAQAPATDEPVCVEWRGLGEADLQRAREAIKTLAAQRVLSAEELPVERMYWVIFPPLPTAAAAQVKLKEIAALKVKDAFIIKDGAWKNGISFGLYSTEDAARRYLRELEGKGVSGLRLETKPKEGTTYFYLIRSEDAATLRDLDAIRANLPATTLTRVACRK
ncbi:MAG: hypothetical protein AB1591_01660 [Pseudomonadota bacterium]